MNNDKEFWASIIKWQGAVTEALETLKGNQKEIKKQLHILHEDMWLMKGKMMAYGAVAGFTAGLFTWVILRYIYH